MKLVARRSMEEIIEPTNSFTNNVREFGRFVCELVDMEQIFRSVHQKYHPEQYEDREPKVIHEPVDWSKYPQSSYTKPSQLYKFKNHVGL